MSRSSKIVEMAKEKGSDGNLASEESEEEPTENPWKKFYQWKYGEEKLTSESECSSESWQMPKDYHSNTDSDVISHIEELQNMPPDIDENFQVKNLENHCVEDEEFKFQPPHIQESTNADENVEKTKDATTEDTSSSFQALPIQKSVGLIGGLDKGMAVEGSKRKVRMWDKRDQCMYCDMDVTNFTRHLQRHHKDEPSVKMIFDLPKGDKNRKIMLASLRKDGNFNLIEKNQLIRPVQRLNLTNPGEEPPHTSEFMPCPYCKGVYRKKSLRKHVKKCPQNENNKEKVNAQSLGQNLMAFNASKSQFINKTRIKNEVYSRMHADRIALVGKSDPVISQYGDDYLKKHRRPHIRNAVSNKVRELGRLLIQLQELYQISSLIEALDTKHFDKVVHAAHIISGYDVASKTFKAPSLAMHMRTNLLYACLAAKTLLLKHDPVLPVLDHKEELKKVKAFRNLVEERWKFDMGSLAQKDLEEKHGEKPQNIPITSDVIKFQNYVLEFCEKSYETLKNDKKDKGAFKDLCEASLVYTMIHNRKRPGDAQYTRVESYTSKIMESNQEEFVANLTEAEKLLNSQYKRITTLGKGSKRIAILFPKKIQNYIDLLIATRSNFIKPANPYLFADPNSLEWMNGPYLMAKFAKNSGANHPETLTSTRLRKQIATVLQALNLSPVEKEQLASFMGHTEKTHNEYYRIPQSLYQTAKVSKLLLLMEKGGAAQYEGKSLDEIDFELYQENNSANSDDDASSESDVDEPEEIVSGKHKSKNQDSNNENKTKRHQNNESKTKKHENNENSDSDHEDSDEEFQPKNKKSKKSPVPGRGSWNAEQKDEMKKFFKNHIKKKISPKKDECLKLKNQRLDLFHEKTWVQIKVFVYNTYTQKKK